MDLLFDSRLAESKSDAKRVVEGGGVMVRFKNKDLKIKDWKEEVEVLDGMVVQFGKRRFVRVKFKK